jgi:integrase
MEAIMPSQARARDRSSTQRVRLTQPRIEAFRCPPGKQQAFLRDTESPRLAVRATAGSKVYVFESTLDGRLIRVKLGPVEAMPLESVWEGRGVDRVEVQRGARDEAARLQMLVSQHIDPRELAQEERAAREAEKRAREDAEERARKEQAQEEQAAEARQKYNLRALLLAYADHLEALGKRKAAGATRTMFKNHVFEPSPELADKPAREVSPHDIAAVVRRVTEAGKERAAGALRSYLSAAFNAAARAPFDARLPSALIPFAVEVNPVQPVAAIPTRARNRTLTPDELAAYIKALGDDLPDQALKLALYAGGQRAAQLVRARVEDWSPDSKTLRLFDGKGRRREPREHLLPLAPKAAAMVVALVERAQALGHTDLFAQHRRAMDPGTPGKRLAEIVRDMKCEPFDVRDVRRTAETMLAGMGISRDVRAQLLSHGIAGVQAQHYDRHGYTQEKRRALVAWERRLEALRTGTKAPGNVTSLRGAQG